MAPLLVRDFLELLRRSNLLTAEQFSVVWQGAFVPAVAKHLACGPASGAARPDAAEPVSLLPQSAHEIAGLLVERGWLTRWQAETLLKGHKTFFFGRYRLLECIGAGGMGAVYKARHERLGRIVALKIMAASFVKDARAVARFRNEIRAVAALNHPHIVAAYDADFVGNVHFLVMEYVAGHDLGWYVERFERLPVGWACECIRQVALGLEHAHQQEMVHRDIKPTNLLVSEDPETGAPIAKLLDLGIARFAGDFESAEAPNAAVQSSAEGLTQTGQLLGTPDFMSPEQARTTSLVDARSDVFSLGCTLFRLLTGHLPFPGETVSEKLSAREKGFPRSLRALLPEAPAGLEAVLSRAMARDPRDRFQTAGEVAAALSPYASAERFQARIIGSPVAVPFAEAVSGSPANDQQQLHQFFAHLATHVAEEQPRITDRPRIRRWRRAAARVPPRAWLSFVAAFFLGVALMTFWRWLTRATLLVDLPLDERVGTTLVVNGRIWPVDANAAVRIPGRPGPWRIRASRPGYEPVHGALTLGAGEFRYWTPVWKAASAPERVDPGAAGKSPGDDDS